MDAEDLRKILELHRKWWLGESGGKRAYLSGANLSGADLSGAYLSRAYLSRAYLSGAYLSGADLSGADLSGADLSGADLSGADLSGANLSRAKLQAALGLPPTLYILKLQPPNTKLQAWKYLADGVSPYQHAAYKVGETYTAKDYSADERELCAEGLNIATLDWCLADSASKTNVDFLEVEFQAGDIIAIPLGTDGKFRVRKLKVLRKLDRAHAQAILDKQLEPLTGKAKQP